MAIISFTMLSKYTRKRIMTMTIDNVLLNINAYSDSVKYLL